MIETQRGHTLGRVIWQGSSLSDTSKPEGDPRRVLRAPVDGIFNSEAKIGDSFEPGQTIAVIGAELIKAPFSGVLRGLLHPGLNTVKGMKIGDIDPRNDPRLCQLVSDKSLGCWRRRSGGAVDASRGSDEIMGLTLSKALRYRPIHALPLLALGAKQQAFSIWPANSHHRFSLPLQPIWGLGKFLWQIITLLQPQLTNLPMLNLMALP